MTVNHMTKPSWNRVKSFRANVVDLDCDNLLKTVYQNLQLINNQFTTISCHFFDNYKIHFTELSTSIRKKNAKYTKLISYFWFFYKIAKKLKNRNIFNLDHNFQTDWFTRLTWIIHTSFLPLKWNLYSKIQFLGWKWWWKVV